MVLYYDLGDGGGRKIVAVGGTLMFLSSTVIGLRIYTRTQVLRTFGWDDGTAIAALVAGLAFAGFGIAGARHMAVGKNLWDIPENDLKEISTKFGKYALASDIIYSIGMLLARASLILLVLRILNSQPSRYMRTIYKALFVINIVYTVARIFVSVFRCTTPSLMWSGKDVSKDPRCHILNNIRTFAKVGPALNATLDILAYILPLQFLLQPGMHLKKRLQLAASFLLGLISIAGSIMIFRIYSAASDGTSDLSRGFSYRVLGELIMWQMIEMFVTIICISLPVLNPLQMLLFRAVRTKFSFTEMPVADVESIGGSSNANSGRQVRGKFEEYGVSDTYLEMEMTLRRDSVVVEMKGDSERKV